MNTREQELKEALELVYRIQQEALVYIWLARITIGTIFLAGIIYLLT